MGVVIEVPPETHVLIEQLLTLTVVDTRIYAMKLHRVTFDTHIQTLRNEYKTTWKISKLYQWHTQLLSGTLVSFFLFTIYVLHFR